MTLFKKITKIKQVGCYIKFVDNWYCFTILLFKGENELINSLNYLLLINCIKICTLTKGILKRDKTKFQESYILRRRIYLLFSTRTMMKKLIQFANGDPN
jgi:hypothetical protein